MDVWQHRLRRLFAWLTQRLVATNTTGRQLVICQDHAVDVLLLCLADDLVGNTLERV